MIPGLTALLPMVSSLLPMAQSMIPGMSPQRPTGQTAPRPVDRSRIDALRRQIEERRRDLENKRRLAQIKKIVPTTRTMQAKAGESKTDDKDDKTLLYVGGGIAVLGVLYIATKGKK